MPALKDPHTADRRVLVTGAAGFVGRHLCSALLREGGAGRIIAAGRRPAPEDFPPEDFPDVEWVDYDLFEPEAVGAMIRAVRPSAVVHLAAIAVPAEARSNPRAAWRANFEAVLELGQAIAEHAPSARLIFAGSAEAYGMSFNNVPLPISEDAPLRPATVYGATKAAAETALVQMAHDGLDAVVFRAFNHTGPGQAPDYVVSAFCGQVAEILAGKRAPRISVGNLSAERDFLDVRDVVQAYVKAIKKDVFSADERILNIASGKAIKIEALLEKILSAANMDISVDVDPARLRPNELPTACGSPERAARALGWEAAIPLDKTIRDLLDWRLAALSSGRGG